MSNANFYSGSNTGKTFGRSQNFQPLSDDLPPGLILSGRYKLIEMLGEGGIGEVWRALDQRENREYALKFVLRRGKDDQAYAKSLENAKQAYNKISELSHPSICIPKHSDEDPECGYFFVMPLLRGKTLKQWLDQNQAEGKKIPPSEIISILMPIAKGLDYIHSQGVVHLDVKPHNIMLPGIESGAIEPKLINFGIVTILHYEETILSQSEIGGTKAYMSPEQLEWRPGLPSPNHLSDQYSLALVAYELLSGSLPVLKWNPEPFEWVSYKGNEVLWKALSYRPSERYKTCVEFITELQRSLADPVSSIPLSQPKEENPKLTDLVKGVFEKTEKYQERLKGYAWIDAGYGEFLPERFDTDKDYFPIRIHPERELPGAEDIVEEIDPKLTPEKAKEMFQKGEIRLYVRIEVEGVEWSVNEIKLKSGTWEYDVRAEMTRKREEERGKAGALRVLKTGGITYRFRYCPAGVFKMGSPEEEKGRYGDETLHEVTLTEGFWLLETPVTREMWESVMGNNPSYFKGNRLPVETVSWNDCQVFCKKVSEATGQKIGLPTEAQWEYACRAGTRTPFHFGSVLNGDQANCNGNYPYGTEKEGKYIGETTPVKSYSPNAWGLYDMHGNVWEWCQDWYWYGDYPSGSVTDPTGPEDGSYRVIRGGCWSGIARDCRCACLNHRVPERRSNGIGFRLLLSSPQG